MKEEVNFFWIRRDLRLTDNAGLYHALKDNQKVIPVFIFDRNILDKLEGKKDARVQFLHQELLKIKEELRAFGSDLLVEHGFPEEVWTKLLEEHAIKSVYTNEDYEPYARERDGKIRKLLENKGCAFHSYKDHVIFEKDEIVKDNGDPYVVYTPYSKKWLASFTRGMTESFPTEEYFDSFYRFQVDSFPSLEIMGFEPCQVNFPSRDIDVSVVDHYGERRDTPSIKGTSRISMHLRFGTVSIRKVTAIAQQRSSSWLNELIWRNFYQMIIWFFPESATNNFREAYDAVKWRNNEDEFQAWCEGRTGYPIVDAGMRELNKTGFMHNRVRMITASFLAKHLLVDWRWGEAYFASKLLDFELASNVGGWQWASGSGCDAAPYFRVFNPELQTKKFDPELKYIRKWVPEYGTTSYPRPIVEHKIARERALSTYKKALKRD